MKRIGDYGPGMTNVNWAQRSNHLQEVVIAGGQVRSPFLATHLHAVDRCMRPISHIRKLYSTKEDLLQAVIFKHFNFYFFGLKDVNDLKAANCFKDILAD